MLFKAPVSVQLQCPQHSPCCRSHTASSRKFLPTACQPPFWPNGSQNSAAAGHPHQGMQRQAPSHTIECSSEVWSYCLWHSGGMPAESKNHWWMPCLPIGWEPSRGSWKSARLCVSVPSFPCSISDLIRHHLRSKWHYNKHTWSLVAQVCKPMLVWLHHQADKIPILQGWMANPLRQWFLLPWTLKWWLSWRCRWCWLLHSLSHSWLLDAHMTVILSSVILSKLHTDILSSVHDCLKIICSWEAIRMMRPIETCAAWN